MFVLLAAMALTGAMGDSPIMCNLNALTRDEREQHTKATAVLKSAVETVDDVADGYRIHLSASMSAQQLLQWVEHESRCCPFLDFEVRLDRESRGRSLQMTGRAGVKEFLAQEFKLASRR